MYLRVVIGTVRIPYVHAWISRSVFNCDDRVIYRNTEQVVNLKNKER